LDLSKARASMLFAILGALLMIADGSALAESPEVVGVTNSATQLGPATSSVQLAQSRSSKPRKKKKKRSKKRSDSPSKEQTPSDELTRADEQATSNERALPKAQSSAGREYVSGEVPYFVEFDRYPVSVLKSEKEAVRASGYFSSASRQAESASRSNTYFVLHADYRLGVGTFYIVPTALFATVSTSLDVTVPNPLSPSEDIQYSSKEDGTLIRPGVTLAFPATPMLDLGLDLHYAIGSRKSDEATVSSSYLLYAFAAGVHSGSYEGGVSYRPSVTYQTKSTVEGGGGEETYASQLRLMGRFKISKESFAGLQYQSESEEEDTKSIIDLEAGFLTGMMQLGGAFGMVTQKFGDATESGFRLQGAVLLGALAKQNFGLMGGYTSISGEGGISESEFELQGTANLMF